MCGPRPEIPIKLRFCHILVQIDFVSSTIVDTVIQSAEGFWVNKAYKHLFTLVKIVNEINQINDSFVADSELFTLYCQSKDLLYTSAGYNRPVTK